MIVGLVRFELTTSSLSVITNVIGGHTVTYGNYRAYLYWSIWKPTGTSGHLRTIIQKKTGGIRGEF